VQETGIDPRQDTDRILMSLPRQVDAGAASGFLIVAEGRFGSSRLVDMAARRGNDRLHRGRHPPVDLAE
jgi:hypothetical protein